MDDTLANGRRLDRREFLSLSAGAAAAAALAACSPSAPSTGSSAGGAAGGAKKLADSVTLASQSIVDTLDPHGTLSNSGFQAARQVFDALMTWQNDRISPQLATEWKRIDEKTIEIKLRDDVKFSNGEAFTAETVKFNVERIRDSKDPLHASTQGRLASIAGAEVVNSTTVRIMTKVPDPIIFNRLTTLFMVPQKYTTEGGDLKTKPIGTGSFKVNEFVVQNRIVFEAWEGTWRGKSTVKSAKILAIPEEAALIAALKTGDIDIINPVSGDKVASLKNDFNVVSVSAGSCTLNSLLNNIEAFKDKRVREAVNLAVNKEEIIQRIFGGYGKPAGQILQPGFLGYRDDIKAVPYDPEKAKSLIKAAGFEGAEVTISVVAAIKAYNEAIAAYLTTAGLKAKVQQYEFPVFVPQLVQKSDNPSIAWRSDYFQLRDFDSAATNFGFRPPNLQDHFPYSQEFKELLRTSQSELDETKRKGLIEKMAGIMRDELPVLFLAWQEFPMVFTKKIEKLETPYDTAVYLWKVEKAA